MMLEYGERDNIQKLEYIGNNKPCNENENDEILRGDLPNFEKLKEISFKNFYKINDESIPFGVELIEYCYWYGSHKTPQFLKLPSTINTILNVSIDKNNDKCIILPNITSISFFKCPNITPSSTSPQFLSIPNTIKTLIFRYDWYNAGIGGVGVVLKKGDIPSSVTELSLGVYNIKNLENGILPNSIKKLSIIVENSKRELEINSDDGCEGLFNFLPNEIEILEIISNSLISLNSNLINFNSIKELTIKLNGSKYLKPNSLPSSVKKLILFNFRDNIIAENTIPNSVTHLEFNTRDFNLVKFLPNSILYLKIYQLVTEPNILPNSLIHLDIECFNILNKATEKVKQFFSILPPSITLLSLPIKYKNIITILQHNNNNLHQALKLFIKKNKHYL